MKRSIRSSICSWLTLLIAVSVAALPATASVQGSFQRTFQVSGPVDLEVFTHSGDITVRSGATGTVSIIGRIHVSDRWFNGGKKAEVEQLEKNPPLRQSGNSIRIDYVNVHDISIDYEITAPAETTVRARTGSGDQRLEGLHGDMDLESGSGDMRLRDLTGDIRTRTGSGNVGLRLPSRAAFDLDLSTSSGTIVVDEPVTTTVQGRVQESRRSISGKVRGGGPMIQVHTG